MKNHWAKALIWLAPTGSLTPNWVAGQRSDFAFLHESVAYCQSKTLYFAMMRVQSNGMFSVSSTADTKTLEQIFRHYVLKMLWAKGKIAIDGFKK